MDCTLPGSTARGDSPGKKTGVGCHALLQGIFPAQGLKPGLPHCRQILFFFLDFFFFCSEFCHTLKWNSHGFTCVPHPGSPSHLPLHPLPLGLPSAPGPSACLMHHSLSEKCKSKPQWGTITHQSGWLLSKSLQAINAGEGVEKREPSYTVGGNAN